MTDVIDDKGTFTITNGAARINPVCSVIGGPKDTRLNYYDEDLAAGIDGKRSNLIVIGQVRMFKIKE